MFRINDYKKQSTPPNKSLKKDGRLFSPAKTFYYEGESSLGPHVKQGTSNKLFYLAPHGINAYFAYEILLCLGVITPKARVAHQYPGKDFKLNLLATKALTDYIPVAAIYNHHLCVKLDKRISDRYQLDCKKQVILDLVEGKEHKISGHFFVSDILAAVLHDGDFQPNGCNVGFIRKGNRFYTAAIDKEKVRFDGKYYGDNLKATRPSFTYHPATITRHFLDQALAVISAIQQALTISDDGLCDIDRIFGYSRVKSALSAGEAKLMCLNFKGTALTLLDYYKSLYGKECLTEFTEREKIREQIAIAVIEQIHLENSNVSLDEIKSIIIEDLRGPYYRAYFTHMPTLINVITNHISAEFNVSKKINIKPQALTIPAIHLFSFLHQLRNKLLKQSSAEARQLLPLLTKALTEHEPLDERSHLKTLTLMQDQIKAMPKKWMGLFDINTEYHHLNKEIEVFLQVNKYASICTAKC